MSIADKKSFYSRLEANELMDEEQERREDNSSSKFELARKILAVGSHQVLLNEIGFYNKPIVTSDLPELLKMEQDYRSSLLGNQGQVQNEPDALQYDLNSYSQTTDHRQKVDSNMDVLVEDNDEIIEEVAQLIEKPHPLPPKPNNYMAPQNNESKLSKAGSHHPKDIISAKTQEYRELKKTSNQQSSFRSPDKLFINQNNNHQMAFSKTVMTPQPKVFYRNNFNKDSKFVEKAQKEFMQHTAQMNLNQELNHLVKSYEPTKDPDQVEDMILELNRLNQKTKGLVPTQQQSKIQKFSSDIEMHKHNYSQVKKSRSPNLRSSMNITTPVKLIGKNQAINVNSEKLKDIITSTESKVKQNLQGTKTQCTTNPSSSRMSYERNYTNSTCQTPHQEQNLIGKASNLDQIKTLISNAVMELNARVLAKFLKRKMNQIQTGDFEVAYLLALLVALVDERIPMTNDKGDLAQKSWEDISRNLSNHGAVIYSLQKIRIAFDKEELSKQLNKIQFVKKYEDMKTFMVRAHESAKPITTFITKIVQGIQQMKRIQQMKEQLLKVNYSSGKGSAKKQSSSKKKDLQLQDNCYSANPMQSPGQTQRTHKHTQSFSGHSSALKTPKGTSVEGQLLQQKKLAIEKTYQLQLNQSKNIQCQEISAKKKQLEIAGLKLRTKAFQARLEKEDKIKQQEDQRNEEIEYIKYTSEFRTRMNSVDQSRVEHEKKRIRESSLDNQDYMRNLKSREKEQEQLYYKQESQSSQKDHQWKQQVQKKVIADKQENCKQTYQTVLLSKVRLNENFLSQKEVELDERLKSQFETASHRFKQLQKQEDKLKVELTILQGFSSAKKNKK